MQDPCLVDYAMRLVLHHRWNFCYIMLLQVATAGFACCAVMTQTACLVLSGDHNICLMRGRLQLLRIAVLLCRILAIQQTQMPSDAVPRPAL